MLTLDTLTYDELQAAANAVNLWLPLAHRLNPANVRKVTVRRVRTALHHQVRHSINHGLPPKTRQHYEAALHKLGGSTHA